MKTESYVRFALFMKWQRILQYLMAQRPVNVAALLEIISIQKMFARQ
jgi:hypothetical protein